MAEGTSACSICLEAFKNPVTIPCKHVFCSGCLKRHEEKNTKEGSFACPLCNKVTVSPQVISGVKKEDTNQRDISKEEISVKCDVCEPKLSATRRCRECEENYCQVCSVTHLKMKASKNHTLYELGILDQQTKVTPHSREFCTTHPEEEIKIVCKTCKNIPLCLFCKISGHDNHTSRILAEEVAEIKNVFEKIMLVCQVRLEQIQTCTAEAKVFDSNIDKLEQEEIMRINVQEQELIRLLENKILAIKQEGQKFRESIRLIYEKVRNENGVLKKQLEKECLDCVTLDTEAKELTKTAKASQIVQRGWYLREDCLKETKRIGMNKVLGMQQKAFTPAGLSKQVLELTMGVIWTDIMKETVITKKTINIFLKSCVKGQPLQLLEVEDKEQVKKLEELVLKKYSLHPRTKLVLKFDGKEIYMTYLMYMCKTLRDYGITNFSIIECTWGQ